MVVGPVAVMVSGLSPLSGEIGGLGTGLGTGVGVEIEVGLGLGVGIGVGIGVGVGARVEVGIGVGAGGAVAMAGFAAVVSGVVLSVTSTGYATEVHPGE